MKKLLLSIAGVFSAVLLFGQTVSSDYLDGAIWFQLNNDVVRTEQATVGGGVEKSSWKLQNLEAYASIRQFGIKTFRKAFPDVGDPKLDDIYRLEIQDASKVMDVIQLLERDEHVNYAERVPFLEKTLTPDDPDFNASTQWALFQVNAEQAWNVSAGSSNVTVAIVDDAVETTHSDLSAAIWSNTGESNNNGTDDDNNGYIDDKNGYDVADDDNDPNPDNPINSYDHGTHVAGIAGAATNNSTGIASIGFGIDIIPVKSTNSSSAITHGYEGIIYAVAAGADVINMSWGGSGSSNTAQNIITYADNQGAILVAAAGNDNVSSVFYPAGYSEVLAVASTTTGDNKSSFSNYGSWIDISAPGSAIYSTVPGDGYATKQGTSMASPMVAGLAGLMLSENSAVTPGDVVNCILSTADDIDGANPSYAGELGAGRINAEAAMNCMTGLTGNAPVADFTANTTNILEGDNVIFSDMSNYNPNNWTWTFNGGNPNTYSGSNPPAIVYNNAGTYEVSLTVSNGNGSDTETKTGYINVNASTGCDTITNTEPNDNVSEWTWGAPNGYILGHNYTKVQYVAEEFTNYGPTNVMGAEFYFTEGQTNDPNAFISIKVWESNAGNPGTELYSEDVLIEDIGANINGNNFTPNYISFDQSVPVGTNDFFIGYELYYNPGDTVTTGASQDLTPNATRDNSLWYYINASDNPLNLTTGWQEVTNIGSIELAMHVYPRITDTPPTAFVTANPTTVCEGEFIDFDGTPSANMDSWEWTINGSSNPNPSGITPSVIMNSEGTHEAVLRAYNTCGFYNEEAISVTVDPAPNVNVTATADTICPGDNVDLTAAGAGNYVWSPGTNLSCTNCANPTATPTQSTTYSVEGTTGSCSSESYYEIVVDNSAPEADFLVSQDTVCQGDLLSVNGASSDGGVFFDWVFNSGNPGTGVGSISSTTYDTPGTYTVELTIENSCNETDNVTKDIVVVAPEDCVNSLSSAESEGWTMFYAADQNKVVIDNPFALKANAYVLNTAGQRVVENVRINEGLNGIPTNQLSKGVYVVHIFDENGQQIEQLKFVK
ncbi:MAG: S8 family serine peptidase [Bacteroidota bacterium]